MLFGGVGVSWLLVRMVRVFRLLVLFVRMWCSTRMILVAACLVSVSMVTVYGDWLGCDCVVIVCVAVASSPLGLVFGRVCMVRCD